MELIGKKIERSEKVGFNIKPTITVNTINGKIQLNSMSVNGTGFGINGVKTIGFAYDWDKKKVYMYQDGDGTTISEKGLITSRFHSRQIGNIFGLEAGNHKGIVSLETYLDEAFPGISFYEITFVEAILKEEDNELATVHTEELN